METITTSNPVQASEETHVSSRQQPIPPPSHPRQFRAIGLIQGQYTPLEEGQITRGKLLTPEGITIEAVILGKVISLIKNHVDLSQSHLWVVYPRTRQENGNLHAQIVGLWEPQTLATSELKTDDHRDDLQTQSGYFSIRGEVIYQETKEEKVIVKIKQTPKIPHEKPKFFKLELTGTFPEQGVGYFWDFQVKLIGTNFVIQEATNIGRILPQKKRFNKFKQKKEGSSQDQKKRKSNLQLPSEQPSNVTPYKPNPIERPKKKL